MQIATENDVTSLHVIMLVCRLCISVIITVRNANYIMYVLYVLYLDTACVHVYDLD